MSDDAMSPERAMYALILRPGADAAAAADSNDGAERLMRIPGVVDRGEGHYEFGERDEHGVMALRMSERQIAVEIPRPWVGERGPRVFALVFMLAEWLHWEVFDPQIDDTLKKEVVLQGMVAMRQAQREQELRADRPKQSD